ncbi:uncharacterized protein V1518DRAFT_414541 [Limtongia smithiae]|uniref:uncharacterized protein n=1 Tax=Limtongia smithiae TaxID=1125753 RepID=UPI0034CDAF58
MGKSPDRAVPIFGIVQQAASPQISRRRCLANDRPGNVFCSCARQYAATTTTSSVKTSTDDVTSGLFEVPVSGPIVSVMSGIMRRSESYVLDINMGQSGLVQKLASTTYGHHFYSLNVRKQIDQAVRSPSKLGIVHLAALQKSMSRLDVPQFGTRSRQFDVIAFSQCFHNFAGSSASHERIMSWLASMLRRVNGTVMFYWQFDPALDDPVPFNATIAQFSATKEGDRVESDPNFEMLQLLKKLRGAVKGFKDFVNHTDNVSTLAQLYSELYQMSQKRRKGRPVPESIEKLDYPANWSDFIKVRSDLSIAEKNMSRYYGIHPYASHLRRYLMDKMPLVALNHPKQFKAAIYERADGHKYAKPLTPKLQPDQWQIEVASLLRPHRQSDIASFERADWRKPFMDIQNLYTLSQTFSMPIQEESGRYATLATIEEISTFWQQDPAFCHLSIHEKQKIAEQIVSALESPEIEKTEGKLKVVRGWYIGWLSRANIQPLQLL